MHVARRENEAKIIEGEDIALVPVATERIEKVVWYLLLVWHVCEAIG